MSVACVLKWLSFGMLSAVIGCIIKLSVLAQIHCMFIWNSEPYIILCYKDHCCILQSDCISIYYIQKAKHTVMVEKIAQESVN